MPRFRTNQIYRNHSFDLFNHEYCFKAMDVAALQFVGRSIRHTCNATKVAIETIVFFFQSFGGYLTVGVPFWVLVNSLNGLWCSHTSIHSTLYFIFN